MSGIIEIWRIEQGGLPTRFTVGNPPFMSDGAAMEDGPVIASIDFRETGAMAGKRLSEAVFCITFEESFVQRFIPLSKVVDIAYETKQASVAKAPALEA